MILIDGKKIKEEILDQIKERVFALSFVPVFCDILVGSDLVSASYVKIKAKNAEKVGIKFREVNFPENITEEGIIKEIQNLNKVPHLCGIIVQLPLPDHLSRQKILDAIDPILDVDCLGTQNSQNFYENKSKLLYPTAAACLEILETLPVNLVNKKFVVLGRGTLVGRPVAHLLKSRGFDVEIIHSQTANSSDLLKQADVIISGVGQGRFINKSMIKEGVIVIDAGTSEENGSVVGDVDFDSVQGVASFLTPSPGGVGPVTVAMLLKNILQVAENKK